MRANGRDEMCRTGRWGAKIRARPTSDQLTANFLHALTSYSSHLHPRYHVFTSKNKESSQAGHLIAEVDPDEPSDLEQAASIGQIY